MKIFTTAYQIFKFSYLKFSPLEILTIVEFFSNDEIIILWSWILKKKLTSKLAPKLDTRNVVELRESMEFAESVSNDRVNMNIFDKKKNFS